MQGDEHPDQELLVLSLEGEGKAVDYAAQDLKQLSHSVEVLRLVDKPVNRGYDQKVLGEIKPNLENISIFEGMLH